MRQLEIADKRPELPDAVQISLRNQVLWLDTVGYEGLPDEETFAK